MAITYAVRNFKRLATAADDAGTEGLALSVVDITIASQSDVGSTGTGSVILSGTTILSSLGFGSTGKVLALLQGDVLGSDGAHRMIIPKHDPSTDIIYFAIHGASNATALAVAASTGMVNGDKLRAVLLGQVGGKA